MRTDRALTWMSSDWLAMMPIVHSFVVGKNQFIWYVFQKNIATQYQHDWIPLYEKILDPPLKGIVDYIGITQRRVWITFKK